MQLSTPSAPTCWRHSKRTECHQRDSNGPKPARALRVQDLTAGQVLGAGPGREQKTGRRAVCCGGASPGLAPPEGRGPDASPPHAGATRKALSATKGARTAQRRRAYWSRFRQLPWPSAEDRPKGGTPRKVESLYPCSFKSWFSRTGLFYLVGALLGRGFPSAF